MREELIGECRLILGDCRDVLPTFGKFDLLLTDPPYGINYKPQNQKRYDGSKSQWTPIIGDEAVMSLDFIFNLDLEKIIFGAENFFAQLPHKGKWICWNKRSHNTKSNIMQGNDFELAWHDIKSGKYKYVNIIHGGVINANSAMGNSEPRLHPTEKPIALMQWCINQAKNNPQTILDPFMGSGTTGVACANMGRKFTGIEREQKYFDIACERIENAYRQQRLFT